jgi:hypothetical protein
MKLKINIIFVAGWSRFITFFSYYFKTARSILLFFLNDAVDFTY